MQQDDLMFDAVLEINERMRRLHQRAALAILLGSIALAGLAATVMAFIALCSPLWIKSAALIAGLTFVASMLTGVVAGRMLSRRLLAAHQARAITSLARRFGATEAELMQWTVPAGDSSEGPLRLNWPRSRAYFLSPIRWG